MLSLVPKCEGPGAPNFYALSEMGHAIACVCGEQMPERRVRPDGGRQGLIY